MLLRRADGPPANARATTVNDGGASKHLSFFSFSVWFGQCRNYFG